MYCIGLGCLSFASGTRLVSVLLGFAVAKFLVDDGQTVSKSETLVVICTSSRLSCRRGRHYDQKGQDRSMLRFSTVYGTA